jgi:hypothetical protein
MKKSIGIVGSGTAGLHLAYAFRNDFDVTIMDSRSADQIKNGRIMSTQVHLSSTKAREDRFQMPKWETQIQLECVNVSIGDKKLFTGTLKSPGSSVDQRLYYSDCIKDLQNRGVTFQQEKADEKNLQTLLDRFDLIIDCTGKKGPIFPFSVDERLSPFQTPQRKQIVGYFKGVKQNKPIGVGMYVLPGQGELIEIPAITEHGPVTILYISAIPNKLLDAFKGVKYAEDFTLTMKDIVQTYFPTVYNRVDNEKFSLCDENGFMQIAYIPVIRKPYLMVQNKLVLGCGDSVFLNDPLTGQGSNLASFSAEQLYETIMQNKDSAWDRRLGESYWNRTKERVEAVTKWTNAMTQPLPEHVIQFLFHAAQNQDIANDFAEWFEDPRKACKIFFS